MTFKNQNYLNHYQKWLQKHETNFESTNPEPSQNIDSQPIPTEARPTQKIHYLQGKGPEEVKVFENDQISVFVLKAFHQRQKRFRLEDSMFHVRVKVKENIEVPLLRDLLNVLKEAFVFILKNIRTYFKPEDHNIAYLTLYQEPMVNGLNTGNNQQTRKLYYP